MDGSPLALELGLDITARKEAENQAVSTRQALSFPEQSQRDYRPGRRPEDPVPGGLPHRCGERRLSHGLGGTGRPGGRVLKPVVQYGLNEGYLESLVISIEDVPEGRGPTGVAVREERY